MKCVITVDNPSRLIDTLNIIGAAIDRSFIAMGKDATIDDVNGCIKKLAEYSRYSIGDIEGMIVNMQIVSEQQKFENSIQAAELATLQLAKTLKLLPPPSKKQGWRRPYKFHR